MPVHRRHSAVAIASGMIGPLAGVLLVLGIVIAFAWSWWAGGIVAAVAVFTVGNNGARRLFTYALAAIVHAMRGERKDAPRPVPY
jgi:hypothetical protein